jgi:hypothetical protein
MTVILKTATREFVKEAKILPFTEYPEFLIWGNRAFKHIAGSIYHECFFTVVLDRDVNP